MKKLLCLLVVVCCAWIVHFHNGGALKIDRLENGIPSQDWTIRQNNGYLVGYVGNKRIILPLYSVAYIEEVN